MCPSPDSYGYRPAKSVLDSVGKARENCWRNGWVLDLDIKVYLDSINLDLLVDAVKQYMG